MKEKLIALFLEIASFVAKNLKISENALIQFIQNADKDDDDYVSLSEFIIAIANYIKRVKI